MGESQSGQLEARPASQAATRSPRTARGQGREADAVAREEDARAGAAGEWEEREEELLRGATEVVV